MVGEVGTTAKGEPSFFGGMVIQATTALSSDSPAQIKITTRNPNTNATRIRSSTISRVRESRSKGSLQASQFVLVGLNFELYRGWEK
jgi:hypothetical protein